jgi:hypothetical protein
MYIGPWQEYNLSRGKASVNVIRTVQQDKLKRDLEQALTSTLDPNAAQAALKAMETILQQQNSVPAAVSLPPIHQYTVISNDQGKVISTTTTIGNGIPVIPQRASHGNPRGQRGAKRRQLQLPPLSSAQPSSPYPSVSSARELSNGRNPSASPLSVRSTKSEPVKLPSLLVNQASLNSYGSSTPSFNKDTNITTNNSKTIFPLTQQNLVKKLQHDQYQQENAVERRVDSSGGNRQSQQPAYDAAALINFLKMERNNQRAKSEICKITGWKQGDKSESGLSHGSGIAIEHTRKSNFDEEKEKKVELVKQMKEMYLQRLKDGDQANLKSPPLGNAQKGDKLKLPVATLSPVQSPRVADIDITEEDLLRVSKYFKALESSSTARISQPSIASSTTAVISQTSLSASSPRQHFVELSDDMESDDGLERRSMKMSKSGRTVGMKAYSGYHLPDINDTTVSIPSTPFDPLKSVSKEAPFMDEYNGGMDSLLNWTKGLNFDDL